MFIICVKIHKLHHSPWLVYGVNYFVWYIPYSNYFAIIFARYWKFECIKTLSISHKMNLLNQYTFFVKLMQSVSFFDISSLRISQGSHNKYKVLSLECKIWERRVSRFRPKQWNSGFASLQKFERLKKHNSTPQPQ